MRRLAALVGLVLVPLSASLAWAAYADSAQVSSGTVSAYTVPKPAWVSCTVTGTGVKTVTIVWNEVSSPIALNYSATASTPSSGTVTLTVTDNGSTRQVAVRSSVLGIGSSTVTITAALPAPSGAWTSTPLTQVVTFTTALIASCGAHN